ncbi:electron transfer flavoprotein subunit beta/FixA family protein [Sporomusa sphaeroides DSM 2875]|uniref:electron transfer flavoprotein subunit beta/FixA family protein n=1 Tax=Sporomusa sphaeroides TaxID=47679 RepID=UPI00202FA87C|nr:electron transfer flavoprotein subunit beta/FixA family protein [Sporomusa sphaeroides DSM 2875]
MEIIVCVKQVPDTTEVKIDPVTNTLIRQGVPSIINPFDKNAVEAALQLKETYGGKITVLSMGPPQAREALKECLAMGADAAILVSDRAFGGSDTLATSYTLAAAIKKIGAYDLILFGKQAIDGDTAQVGPETAEHLDIAQVTYASKIGVSGNLATIEREHEEGYEIIEVRLPAVVTVIKTLNYEPRYPSVKGTMKANRTEITVWTATDLSVEEHSCNEQKRVLNKKVPPVRIQGVRLLQSLPRNNQN